MSSFLVVYLSNESYDTPTFSVWDSFDNAKSAKVPKGCYVYDILEIKPNATFGAESKDLIFSGNFTGQHNGADYDVSYQCSHDIDSTYEDDIRDYVEPMIPDKEYGGDSGYESFEMSTGFYDGEIEIEGTITWKSTMNAESFNAEKVMSSFLVVYLSNESYDNPTFSVWDSFDNAKSAKVPKGCYVYDILEIKPNATFGSESFAAPTGYNEQGPRPFYGNPRKMALDRWGNRRFIRRRKDGTYMKNVDVGRSLAMDRRRQSTTWAPAGYRDQGDGSPSLLVRLLDMFRGVDEEILMAESYLMCADCDAYSSECGCHNSESDAYIFAYNDGHSDARRDGSYRPSTTDREITSFKKIFKQAEDENLTVNQQKLADAFEDYGYYDDSDPTIITGIEIADQKTFQKLLKVCQENDGIIDSSHPAEAYIIAIKCWQSIFQ